MKLALKARKDHRVHLEMRETLDPKASLDLQVPLAHQ